PAAAAALGSCLAIPYRNSAGECLTDYARFRPDNPRIVNGKAAKYEAPKGLGNRIYIPPGTVAKVACAGEPLIITEGEKKAARAAQHGFACIGISGVWSWTVKRLKDGERQLIADLAGLPWKGRKVYIVFDSDAVRNKSVRRAQTELAGLLSFNGAKVRIVTLTDGPTSEDGKPQKVGLDDYMVQNGVDAFRALLNSAVAATEKPSKDECEAKPGQMEALAAICNEAEFFHDGQRKGFAQIQVGGHREIIQITNPAFRRW